MTEEQALLTTIEANPEQPSLRGIFADWLDEHDRHDEAIVQRLMAFSVREVSLKEMQDDYDWESVFGEKDNGGNTSDQTDAIPPGADVSITPPVRADVKEILAAVNGENDGNSWVGLFLLHDGRFLVASGSCDYTGWDCRGGNCMQVAATLNDAIGLGLNEEERARLNVPARL